MRWTEMLQEIRKMRFEEVIVNHFRLKNGCLLKLPDARLLEDSDALLIQKVGGRAFACFSW